MIPHQFALAEDLAPHPWATTIFLPSMETGSCPRSVLCRHDILLCMRLKKIIGFFLYRL